MVDILPSEFDPVADNNVSFPDGSSGFLNLGEGCPPSNVNDGMRSLAASQSVGWGGMPSGATRPTDLRAHRLWRDTSATNVHVIYYWDGFQNHMILAVNPASGGQVASRIPFFDDLAALELAYIPANTPMVGILGRTAPDDGGFTMFEAVGSDPGHGLDAQSADGQYWEGKAVNGEITNKQIGETGTGSDDTTVLNLAFTTAAAMGVNLLLIGDLIANMDVGDGSTTYESPPRIRGLGRTYDGVYQETCTRIRPNNDLWPIINFSNIRGAELSDIGLVGNVNISRATFTATGVTPTTQAYWDGIYGARQRYNQPCAVAIDAYAGPTPSGGGYAGKTYLGSGAQSSAVKVSKAEITAVDGGLLVQPGDHDANGDFPWLEDVAFTCVRDAVSIGNSQCRNALMNRCAFNRVETVISTDRIGKQVGRYLGSVNNSSGAGYIGRLVSVGGLATPGPIRFNDCDFESLHQMYDINGNVVGAEGHLSYSGGSLNFRHESQGVVPGAVIRGEFGGTIIRNDGIKTFDAVKVAGTREILNLNTSNVIWRNGAYVKFEGSAADAQAIYDYMFGVVDIDSRTPHGVGEILDGQNFASFPTPTQTTAVLAIVSVVDDIVTFTGHPAYATYGDGTLVVDREGEAGNACMIVTGDGTARLITNFDFNTNLVLETIPSGQNFVFYQIP